MSSGGVLPLKPLPAPGNTSGCGHREKIAASFRDAVMVLDLVATYYEIPPSW